MSTRSPFECRHWKRFWQFRAPETSIESAKIITGQLSPRIVEIAETKKVLCIYFFRHEATPPFPLQQRKFHSTQYQEPDGWNKSRGRGKEGRGASQIRKHCKVKTQASQVAPPQTEYYIKRFLQQVHKTTRLNRKVLCIYVRAQLPNSQDKRLSIPKNYTLLHC